MTLPAYLMGYNCTLASVTPVTIAGDGTISLGSAANLKTLGVYDLFEFQGNLNLVNIKPADYQVANYVPVYDDFTFRVGEIMRPSVVPTLWSSVWNVGAYFRAEVDVQFPAGSVVKFAVIGVRETVTYEVIEEKNAVVLTARPCGLLPYCGTGTPPF